MKVLRFLFSLLTRNFLTKLLALALAVVVWFGLDTEITDRTRQDIPIDILLVNQEHWRIVEREPLRARVTLKGARADIDRIGELVMRNSLRGAVRFDENDIRDEGQNKEVHTVAITPSVFNLRFRDLTFESIQPEKIQITLVRVGEKELKVRPALAGEPEKGFLLARTKVSPSSIKVRGPLVALSKHQTIDTETLFLHGMDASFEETVNVASTLDGYAVSGRPVTVQVDIVPEPGEKTLERVPLRVVYPAGWPHGKVDIEIDERLDVKVRGPAVLVEKLRPRDLLAMVELDNTAWNEWMDPDSQSQYAQAPLLCMVVGPDDETCRQVKPLLPAGGSIRYKVIRRKEKKQ